MDYKENHRFRLPEDQKYRNYINAVKMADLEMKINIPEYIGCVLTGSLSYGKTSTKSDIDTYLFIDPNKISTELISGKVLEHRYDLSHFNDIPMHFFTVDGCRYYAKGLINILNKKLNLPSHTSNRYDIVVLALSNKIIDDSIENFKKENIHQQNLIRMFHLGINDKKLRVYRKYALDKLALEKNRDGLIKKLFDDVVYCETATEKNRDNKPNYNISVHYRV